MDQGMARAGFATHGVFEEGVAAVHDNVARRQVRNDLLQRLINWTASRDHHQDAARPFQGVAEFWQRLGCDKMTVTVSAYEAVNPLRLQVPHRDAVMVVIKVECQILAHDAKTDDAELRRLQGLTRGRHESLLSGGRRLPRRWSETPLP